MKNKTLHSCAEPIDAGSLRQQASSQGLGRDYCKCQSTFTQALCSLAIDAITLNVQNCPTHTTNRQMMTKRAKMTCKQQHQRTHLKLSLRPFTGLVLIVRAARAKALFSGLGLATPV